MSFISFALSCICICNVIPSAIGGLILFGQLDGQQYAFEFENDMATIGDLMNETATAVGFARDVLIINVCGTEYAGDKQGHDADLLADSGICNEEQFGIALNRQSAAEKFVFEMTGLKMGGLWSVSGCHYAGCEAKLVSFVWRAAERECDADELGRIQHLFDSIRILNLYGRWPQHALTAAMDAAIRTQNRKVVLMVLRAGGLLYPPYPITTAIETAAARERMGLSSEEFEMEFDFIQFLLFEGEHRHIDCDVSLPLYGIRKYDNPQMKLSTINSFLAPRDARYGSTERTLLDFVVSANSNSDAVINPVTGATICQKVERHLEEVHGALTFVQVSQAKHEWDEQKLEEMRAASGDGEERRRMVCEYFEGLRYFDRISGRTLLVRDIDDVERFLSEMKFNPMDFQTADTAEFKQMLSERKIILSMEMLHLAGFTNLERPSQWLLFYAAYALDLSAMKSATQFGGTAIVRQKVGPLRRTAMMTALTRQSTIASGRRQHRDIRQHREIIKFLIESGASVRAAENEVVTGGALRVSYTPLTLAAVIGDIQIVALIMGKLRSGGAVANSQIASALRWATANGNVGVAEYLRSEIYPPYITAWPVVLQMREMQMNGSDSGTTAQMTAGFLSDFGHRLGLSGHTHSTADVIRGLSEKMSDIMASCHSESVELSVSAPLLIELIASQNGQHGATYALQSMVVSAAMSRDMADMRALQTHLGGPLFRETINDARWRGPTGYSPLMLALFYDNAEMASFLLEAGAAVDAVGNDGISVHWLWKSKSRTMGSTIFLSYRQLKQYLGDR